MSERTQKAPARACEVDGCSRSARARGMCNRHYENQRLRGSPVPRRDLPLGDRLREVGWTVTERGCWEWRGARNGDGYGIFNAPRLNLVNARAHRIVYEHLNGTVPDGLVLRHSCDNPPCVNPDHLSPGTHTDNMQDMVERGRAWWQGRTECQNGHDITAEDATRTVKRKHRTETICVQCARARARRYDRKKPTIPSGR